MKQNFDNNSFRDFEYIQGMDAWTLPVTSNMSPKWKIQITPLTALAPDVQIATKGAFYLQSKAAGSGEED